MLCRTFARLIALGFWLPLSVPAAEGRLTVLLDQAPTPISRDLFGVFFEDLNFAADGGLYAEMIPNRSFEYSAAEQPTWTNFTHWELRKGLGGEGKLGIGDARPVAVRNPHYLLLDVTTPGQGVGVENRGVDRLPLVGGKSYEASFWAYQTYMGIKWGAPGPDEGKAMPVELWLEDETGAVVARAQVEVKGRDWKKYSATFVPTRSVAAGRFVLVAMKQGGLALDMVSLFPRDTFKGRSNGLRRDLAETIANLQPRFVRFPGGCLVHGPGPRRYYDWKKTVGPVETRQAERNSWGYHQTFGLGYFEYFQFCEDLGAFPLPVVTAGVCCQHAGDSPGHGQEPLPMEEMAAYIQDVFDLVEWANGPATSKWGSVRAAAGHPAPFGLKYLGVGNEDAITPDFKVRFALIQDALREKHPEITVVGTSGPFPDGEDFELGWEFARKRELGMVDEHYYRPPEWFWGNLHRYDHYDRKGPKVYVGEYAAHEKDRRKTLRTALAEAAFLTSLERNGDVVRFASYAPLLARRGHTQWTPDLIYFDAEKVYPSINYTVQTLFGQNMGDLLVPSRLEGVNTPARVASSVVKDSMTGDLIVKIVNGSGESLSVSLLFSGVPTLSVRGRKTVLAHASEDVVNIDGEPPAVRPIVESVTVSPGFQWGAPAHSLTIVRLAGLGGSAAPSMK